MAAIAAATLVAGAYGYVRYGAVRTITLPAERLTIATVHRGAFNDYAAVQGVAAPSQSIMLDSVDGGQVDALFVDEGAVVKAGQPIARLINRRLALDLAAGEGQLAQQQNGLVSLQLVYAQNDLQHQQAIEAADHQIAQLGAAVARYGALVDKGLYPRAALEEQQRDLAYQRDLKALHEKARADDRERLQRQLEAQRRSTERQAGALSLIRSGMDDLVVRAPIAGRVSSLSVKPGQAIAAGQRIGQVDTTDRFKVAASVDEFYLGRVAPGQAAEAAVGGASFPLRVDKVYPDVHDRVFKVDLGFAGAPPDIHAGQNLTLRIHLGRRDDRLIVDNGPFNESGQARWAFVVAGDGRSAARRAVRLGRQNAESVEVLSGLAEGERILTSTETLDGVQRILITGGALPAINKGARP